MRFYHYVFEKHVLLDGFSSTLDLNTYQFFKNIFETNQQVNKEPNLLLSACF